MPEGVQGIPREVRDKPRVGQMGRFQAVKGNPEAGKSRVVLGKPRGRLGACSLRSLVRLGGG